MIFEKRICKPLIGQTITLCAESCEHLSGLDLADLADEGSQMQVDILTGSDYYWELVTGKVCRGQEGQDWSCQVQCHLPNLVELP